jgi:hypothetical protein
MALIGYALARGRASRSEFSRPAKRGDLSLIKDHLYLSLTTKHLSDS